MAKSFGQVQKIYNLKTIGYPDVDKQLTKIAKDFDEIKKAKRSAEGKLLNTSDTAEIKKFSDEIAKLKIQEQQLRVERQKMQNEQKAANIARQEEIRIQKEKLKGNSAEAGSIAAIRLQIKELNAALIQKNQKGSGTVNFQGETLSINQAVAKLKELTAAEQEFRRQFAKDQTLVGEYTTGIVQSFKQMGLDDLVGGQITRTKDRLNSLNTDFDRLQKELAETKAAGLQTETIEKQMIENRNEVIKLDTELVRLRKDLRGTGDVGNQISTSIANGFKSLKGQVAGFALSYIGFSALFNKLTSQVSEGVAEASKIEGVTQAFNNLNKPGLLDNLRAATKGTVSDLELMQRAVQASNFQIPLETLGSLLEFARRRAKDTGQEVNFLVDSIVTGIGRKSPLILDNLGISAVRLRQNLKGLSDESATVGDVAAAVSKIIAEENAKAGKELDTQSERIAKNKAEWQNLRAEFTKNLLPALATLGSVFLFLVTNLPTITTLVGVLAAGWAVANVQLILQNAQLVLYNLLIIRNYIALGVLSAVQLGYNIILFAFNGVLKIVTAGLRLFGITAATASGPLGIILTIVALLGSAILGLSKAMGNTADAIDKNTQRLRIMSDLQKEAAKNTAEQRSKVESLAAAIVKLKGDQDSQMRVLKQLIDIDPIFQKTLVDGKINYEKLNDALKEYNKNLLERATLEAAQIKNTAEKQELERLINVKSNFKDRLTGLKSRGFGDLSDEEKEFLSNAFGSKRSLNFTSSLLNLDLSDKEINDAVSKIDKAIEAQRKVADATGDALSGLLTDQIKKDNKPGPAGRTIEAIKKDLEQANKDFEKAIIGSPEKKELEKKIANLEKELELASPKKKTTTTKDSRLTAEQKDAFKDIDALRDKEIADEKIRLQTQEINEERFHKNILTINQDAIDKKLKLLKGSSAEERKQIAELNLEKITQEQETNNKIFDINTKLLKDQLDAEIANIKLRQAAIENDLTISETDRAQAKLDSDNDILNLQIQFNAQIDALEKQLAQNSLNNAEESADAIRKTKEEILQDEKDLTESRLKKIETDGNKELAKITAKYAKLRQAIINNDKLTVTQRKRALEKLDAQENFTVLSSEVKKLSKEFKLIQALYKAGLKSEEDFLNKKAQLAKAKADRDKAQKGLQVNGIDLPSEQNSQNLLRERLSKSFGFKEGSVEDQLLGSVISESFNIAQDAMNSYFDAEENRIRQNLDLQLQRLDMEKEQVLARAQTQEEIASIEKQFAAKKRKAEIEAGEQLKKTKKAEAKIALATELANIAASAASAGFAAPILFGILAALALGRYALRVSEINSQKFERGGVPVKAGGKITGPSHAHGGVKFEAEGGELAILTKEAAKDKKIRTISGTTMQIASLLNQLGGGISFAHGAKLKKFESGGMPGGSLQPPVFTNSGTTIIQNSISKDDMKEIMDEVKDEFRNVANEQSKRIDRLEVVQVTKSVTEAQRKEATQSSVGTL